MARSRPKQGHGKGKRSAGVGTPDRTNQVSTDKGPGMGEILRGETPADPEAEIEAKRYDNPTEELPPDAAEIRRRRGEER